MNLGVNSNVKLGDVVYHVQTEDRGAHHPFIDTVVISQGQVVHRQSTSYEDLLAGGVADQGQLRVRVEQQHRDILEAVRAGSLRLGKPAAASAPPAAPPVAIEVKLRNPSSWLAAGQASLEIEVCSRADGRPVAGANLTVAVEGAAGPPAEFTAQTGADGCAELHFVMPRLKDPADAGLIIRARAAQAEDQLRYRLKPKQHAPVPSAP